VISKVESERFGKSVHRFTFGEVDRDAVRAIRSARPDVAFVRIPAEKLDQLPRLEIYGVPPLVADTLVYYECDLASCTPGDVRNAELPYREIHAAEREKLSDLVAGIFKEYKNHYASNPLFRRQDILDAFVDWGLSFLREDPNRVCSAAFDGDRPVAFTTCERDGDQWEGVLYGVDGDYAGRGIYTDLITLTQREGIARGCKTMLVSTQIQNLAVQRAWLRRGFRLTRSVNTVHLNLLLSDDYCLARAEEEVAVDGELVERFGELVGDRNPVHFDDAAARAAGFDGRISHGALLNGFVSRVLGMRLPGEGTIYLSQRSFYLRPVYLGQRVRVVVRIKHAHPESGRIIAVTEVLDESGAPVFSGQAELLNPGFVAALST
jgi:acyl dehydratase